MKVRTKAFTLVELLVAVTIIVLLLGIVVPAIGLLSKSGGVDSGVNAINAAVAAARAYATKSAADFGGVPDPIILSSGSPSSMSTPLNGKFSGTALLFTPSNEIRFLVNDQFALSEETISIDNPTGYLQDRKVPINGYKDIPGRDAVTLPSNIGVVGIVRGDSGLGLLAPPFAVRFNQIGQLVSAIGTSNNSRPKLVYYDGDFDGKYSLKSTSRRSAGYDPVLYDPTASDPKLKPHFSTDNIDKTDVNSRTYGRIKLPFEEIETVVGVIVFSKSDFRGASDSSGKPLSLKTGADSTLGIDTAKGMAGDWILKQVDPNKKAKALFFSRYSGSMLRE